MQMMKLAMLFFVWHVPVRKSFYLFSETFNFSTKIVLLFFERRKIKVVHQIWNHTLWVIYKVQMMGNTNFFFLLFFFQATLSTVYGRWKSFNTGTTWHFRRASIYSCFLIVLLKYCVFDAKIAWIKKLNIVQCFSQSFFENSWRNIGFKNWSLWS